MGVLSGAGEELGETGESVGATVATQEVYLYFPLLLGGGASQVVLQSDYKEQSRDTSLQPSKLT